MTTEFFGLLAVLRARGTRQFFAVTGGLLGLWLVGGSVAAQTTPGSLDTTFVPPALSGRVNTVAAQPDGKIVIGGDFDTLGGNARAGVARLNPDGSPDADFNQGVGLEPGGVVRALTLLPDGKILIAGAFGSYNGSARTALARLNADGSLDTAFQLDPAVTRDFAGIDMPIPIVIERFADKIVNDSPRPYYPVEKVTNVVSGINTLAVTPDGKILIGGSFHSRTNSPSVLGAARLHANGNLDTTFRAEAPPDSKAGSNGLYPSVNFVAPLADGSVVLAGDRNTVGISVFAVERHLADGTLMWASSSYPTLVGNSWNSVLTAPVTRAFAAQADGKVIMTSFYSDTGYGSFSPQKHAAVQFGRLLPFQNLMADTTFLAPGNLDARSLFVQADGKILVAGNLAALAGHGQKSLARLIPSGALDSTFDAGSGPDGEVRGLATQLDGKILLAGDFQKVNGSDRPKLARLHGDSVTAGPPVLQRQPEGRRAGEGESVTLSVAVTGGPRVFQWRLNGQPVAGATNDILSLAAFRPSQAGDYDVVVSNASGSVTSRRVRLDIATAEEALELAGLQLGEIGTLRLRGLQPSSFYPGEGYTVQTGVTHDGVDAVAFAPSVPDFAGGGTSGRFAVTFTGPGTFSFWWRVSASAHMFIESLPHYQTLQGSTNWQRATVTIHDFGTFTSVVRFQIENNVIAYIDELRFESESLDLARLTPARVARGPDTNLNLEIRTVPGASYSIFSTTDLKTWSAFGNLTSTGDLELKRIDPPADTHRFYQVIKQPPGQ